MSEIPSEADAGPFRFRFQDKDLERLYIGHSLHQKRSGLQCLLLACAVFSLYCILVQAGQNTIGYAGCTTALILSLAGLIWCAAGFNNCAAVWSCVPYASWLLATSQLLIHLILRSSDNISSLSPNNSSSSLNVNITNTNMTSYSISPINDVTARSALGWTLLLVYLVYVTLPLRLRFCVALALTSCVAYIVTVILLIPRYTGSEKAQDPLKEQLANCILLFMSNIMGLMSYYLEDAQQRRAFLETRQSLQVKLVIEEQSAEQERLLLSVLPEHVAVKMRQDLGSTDSQFKKIYMSRHENVSILYADIVGFTAISSTYSAQDLVKILNELFARFDRLAEKYQQLRIKILGDCYYCISGAPVERPDHAVLCVHMGLSMVKAIKYVQQTTNSPVDMRVGIHTGAVLAGVLGQRQWQFDVYSKDVELANKMESSGMPGRVHISHQTLSFLDGEFEVEPAYGERKEEALRMAGIKTYFIVKVIKPYSSTEAEVRNGGILADNEETILAEEFDNKNEEKCASPIAHSGGALMEQGCNMEDSEDFKNRLSKELDTRYGHRELKQRTSCFTLSFNTSATERQYSRHREPLSALPLLALPLAALAAMLIAHLTAQTASMQAGAALAVVGIILLVLSLLTAAETCSGIFPRCIVLCSRAFNDSIHVRRFVAILAVAVLAAANVIDMYSCRFSASGNGEILNCTLNNGDIHSYSNLNSIVQNDLHDNSHTNYDSLIKSGLKTDTFNIDRMTEYLKYDRMTNSDSSEDKLKETNSADTGISNESLSDKAMFIIAYLYPSYFNCAAVLCLVAAAILPQLSYLAKTLLMLLVTGAHFLLNFFWLADAIDCEDARACDYWNSMSSGKVTLSAMLLGVTIALAFLARHTERGRRTLFLWRLVVGEQRECACDMRARNEQLVYNVLPRHVAAHFMGERARSRAHDELYSQSYAEVGVLFASMPNFSDFYSEETVNNQGLECLRFLNEVISDFDALLESPQFKDIIKIKTIGSTYMAASGLKPSDSVQNPQANVTTRWSHLSVLVDFALELKRALQCINEQSFNHFVLKMGINHGPITAGVIGAGKPHYDIWGNTVNVASRMESTGKAGAIQVTEETCDILQNFGYTFEQRGLVAVKGKGQLMTYYLQGKTTKPPASPLIGLTTMETLQEEDELCHGDSDSGASPSGGFEARSPGSVRLRSLIEENDYGQTNGGFIQTSQNSVQNTTNNYLLTLQSKNDIQSAVKTKSDQKTQHHSKTLQSDVLKITHESSNANIKSYEILHDTNIVDETICDQVPTNDCEEEDEKCERLALVTAISDQMGTIGDGENAALLSDAR